jgi:hypothetical protein
MALARAMRSLVLLFTLFIGLDVCAGEPITMETQGGQPISIAAYSNYGFSDCKTEDPPVINIIKKPIHGNVVIIHRISSSWPSVKSPR